MPTGGCGWNNGCCYIVTKYGQVENESKVFAEVKCIAMYVSESDIIYVKKARQYAVNILYSCAHLSLRLGVMLRGLIYFMQFTWMENIEISTLNFLHSKIIFIYIYLLSSQQVVRFCNFYQANKHIQRTRGKSCVIGSPARNLFGTTAGVMSVSASKAPPLHSRIFFNVW